MLLHEYQTELFESMMSGNPSNKLLSEVSTNLHQAESRLLVYKNSADLGLIKTLVETYPVVEALVGEECFYGMAYRFIEHYKPACSNLNLYGHEFAKFIKEIPELSSIPFLGDMAFSEWLIQESLLAADPNLFDYVALSKIPEEVQPNLSFNLQPTIRLIESKYPVDKIWAFHQSGSDNTQPFDLVEGQYFCIINRINEEITFTSTSDAIFNLLKLISSDMSLSDLLDEMSKQGYDESESLNIFQKLLTDGYFASFTA